VGASTLSQLRQPLHFAYQQTLENGTQYAVGFDGAKNSSNDSFATFNPALTANFNVVFTQPLLRNRGAAVNRLPTLIARTRYRMSRYNLEEQVSRLLQAAEDVYWEVVEARENLRVQRDALASLSNSLKRSQMELELGEMAPVEMYQPQQVIASEEVRVTEARSRLQQAEDALRRQIGADMNVRFREMPLVLTEAILPPYDDQTLDREVLIQTAFQKRRDMEAALQSLAIDDMTFEQRKNALLPDVSLVSTYRSSGRGGQFVERSNVFSSDGSAGEIVRTTPGGLGDALGQLVRFGYPTYAVGLNVAFPIRDRRGAADLADAAVGKRLDTLRVRALQQQIRLDVSDAATRVEGSRAAVRFAQSSVDFARKRVEAEQRKYELGATTIFFLLDAQNSLTRAEADLVAQSAQYRHNLVNLLRVTGKLPEERGVLVQ
jgi:outer membrane protein TolC